MKKRLKIKIIKKGNKTSIYIKTPKEIEDLYKGFANAETSQSAYWFDKEGKGAMFYKETEEISEFERTNAGFAYFSEFGSGLYEGNRINLAILRICGISQGVEITSDRFQTYSNMDLENYIRNIANYVKTVFEKTADKKITANISFDI